VHVSVGEKAAEKQLLRNLIVIEADTQAEVCKYKTRWTPEPCMSITMHAMKHASFDVIIPLKEKRHIL
jgi:hypothetical protein